MKEEIKEILKKLKENISIVSIEEEHLLLDYITNLQEKNERLKQNQVKALNRIKDFIKCSKCEITEGSYSNDKHSQYWSMFKRFAEELQDKIKGIDTKDYVYIPKWREQELLNQEEQLEDYKQRNERAIDYIEYEYEKNIIITDYADNPITPQEEYGDLLNILKGDKDE